MNRRRLIPPAPSLPVAQERIEDLIRVCRHHNVFPLSLDSHYPAKGNHPVGQLLTDLVPEVAGHLKTRSQGELDETFRELPFGLFPGRFGAGHGDFNDPIALERYALCWIIWHTQREYFSWSDIVLETGEDAVLTRFPELAGRFDPKDGLLHLSDDMKLMRGGILYRDHVLHYHQGLRRAFTSNPNFEFLDIFLGYQAQARDRNAFRVGVDRRRVMHASFYREVFESDHWFGAPFQRERLDNRYDRGVTAFVRSQPSPFDFFFGTLVRTEVFRSVDGDIKSFEMEELNDVSEARGEYVLNRYVHAERDMRRGIFRHFDGAVKVYLKEQYAERIQCGRTLPDKTSFKKIKVFRIDGEIDADTWVDLTLRFFRGNELVLEYFDPDQYRQECGPEIARYQQLVAEGKLSH